MNILNNRKTPYRHTVTLSSDTAKLCLVPPQKPDRMLHLCALP